MAFGFGFGWVYGTAAVVRPPSGAILMEGSGYLLLESGSHILLG